MASAVLFLVAIGATLAVLKDFRALPARVKARFERLRCGATNARYQLDGQTARVIHDIEVGYVEDSLDVHLVRICCNPAGEYFHVTIDGDREAVKHLPADHARMVIKQFPKAYAREFGGMA